MDPNHKKQMPDIAKTGRTEHLSPLEWVGMEKVAVPLQLKSLGRVSAMADVFVDLAKEDAKGIHMSRLYLTLQRGFAESPLSAGSVTQTLKAFVESQQGLATSAKLVLRWQEMHIRKALLSDFQGWKTYPVEIEAVQTPAGSQLTLRFSVFYSSACPCSAALARQLYQQAFAKEFCQDNMSFDKVFRWLGETPIAVPHSQRSRADIEMVLKNNQEDIEFLPYINALEDALGTPVQTAVKREDEQEFARLNGVRSMFVEDALRTMKKSLAEFSELESFQVKTHHFESLHAHDAVGSILSHE